MRGMKIELLITALLTALAVISGCGGGGGGSDATPSPTVVVSGVITFDFVPADKVSGLVYASTIQKPARGIVIEAINAADSSILAIMSTDGFGNYSVTVPVNTNIKIRIKAQMLKLALHLGIFRSLTTQIARPFM